MARVFAGVLSLMCGLVIAANGAQAQSASFKVIYTFKGAQNAGYPDGRLIQVGPLIYGTSVLGGGSSECTENFGCGTVYSLNIATGAEHLRYGFGNVSGDGLQPYSGLTAVGNKLYGLTVQGGASMVGTIFTYEPSTGVETTVYAFQGGSDGSYPQGEMAVVNGILYGMTVNGGDATNCESGCGTIFALDPATGIKTTVYDFEGGVGGAASGIHMTNVGGLLYGVNGGGLGADSAGDGGKGRIFAFDPVTGTMRTLYEFQGGSDGFQPSSSLLHAGGLLYGSTRYGGITSGGEKNCVKLGCGTIFVLDPKTGAETVLYSFPGGRNGRYPSGVVQRDGKFYGTTSGGGSANCSAGCGTVFSLDPTTGAASILYDFGGKSGESPSSELLNVGGTLYGTTAAGANKKCDRAGCGTLYAITP